MAARRRKPPTFDFSSAARYAAHATERTRWMSDDPSTIALAVLELHPNPERVTWNEVLDLVRIIATEPDARLHLAAKAMVGGLEVTSGSRDVRMGNEVLHHSPRMPGIFRAGEIPDEPGIEDKAMRMIREQLAERRYKGGAILSVRQDRQRGYGFGSMFFTLERPEGGGTYEERGNFEHDIDEHMVKEAKRLAESIDLRHRNRHDIYGRIAGAGRWAEEVARDIEGMEYQGANTPTYINYGKGGTIDTISVSCIFSIIGHTLTATTGNATAHNDDHVKTLITQHRRHLRKLADGGVPTETRTVDPILAAAVRARMDTYGADMLAEIEAAIAGRGMRPTHPVKRGIALFNMRGGELVGPVKLGKGVKLHKERVCAASIKGLPDTLMNALPGKRMREIIDHPWLEGLIIRSATISSDGLALRPVKASQPLEPLLEELRAAVAAQTGA